MKDESIWFVSLIVGAVIGFFVVRVLIARGALEPNDRDGIHIVRVRLTDEWGTPLRGEKPWILCRAPYKQKSNEERSCEILEIE